MPRIDATTPVWVNPMDVDHNDPLNQNNPMNANYYLVEAIHKLGLYVDTKVLNGEEINVEEICNSVEYLQTLVNLARENVQAETNGKSL